MFYLEYLSMCNTYNVYNFNHFFKKNYALLTNLQIKMLIMEYLTENNVKFFFYLLHILYNYYYYSDQYIIIDFTNNIYVNIFF